MAEKITIVRSNGAVPEVEITIGQAQFGKYELYLWDPEGTNPVLIGSGLNTDSVPDVFSLGVPAAGLQGKMLSWQCIVSPLKKGPGQKYAVIVEIRQDGSVLPDSPYKQTGPLTATKIVHDYTRFEVR